MRLNEPVDYSAWNWQPTLRVTDVAKTEVSRVQALSQARKSWSQARARWSGECHYMSPTCWFASEALRKPKSWLPCLHPHASPSLTLPVRQGYQDCCVREEIRVANCCEITGFFRSDFARRCCTSSSACLLSSYEASAEEVVACFSTENTTLFNSVCWQPVYFTHKKNVPCVLHVTILAHTISRLETGVQSAKSHMEETDVFSQYPWNCIGTLLETQRVLPQRNKHETFGRFFFCFWENKHIFQYAFMLECVCSYIPWQSSSGMLYCLLHV